jgi:hypothetical protein
MARAKGSQPLYGFPDIRRRDFMHNGLNARVRRRRLSREELQREKEAGDEKKGSGHYRKSWW